MANRHGQNKADKYAAARRALIRNIERGIEKVGTGDGERSIDPKVLEALGKVPRERFVPEWKLASAYDNKPLSIGHGQTISQPLIVALMTHHLRLEPTHRVLEVGTGSGYQTAVLAELSKDIVTVENVTALASTARMRLDGLGYTGIRFMEGDGRSGSSAHAPFDRIIVTAAAEKLPDDLIEQLAFDGRLVAPVGRQGTQQLVVVSKSKDNKLREQDLFPVAFVPLT